MIELRNITPAEFERWLSTESRAHGNRLNHDPEHLRPRFDLARSIAVFYDRLGCMGRSLTDTLGALLLETPQDDQEFERLFISNRMSVRSHRGPIPKAAEFNGNLR